MSDGFPQDQHVCNGKDCAVRLVEMRDALWLEQQENYRLRKDRDKWKKTAGSMHEYAQRIGAYLLGGTNE